MFLDFTIVKKNGTVINTNSCEHFLGWSLIQGSLYGEYGFSIKTLAAILATEDGREKGYFVDVGSEETVSVKRKTRFFPLGPEAKKVFN